MTYILRAYDRAGDVGYYTGKAGSEWVNNQIANAFGFDSLDLAMRRISQFNKFEPIHRLMFRVENLEDERNAAESLATSQALDIVDRDFH